MDQFKDLTVIVALRLLQDKPERQETLMNSPRCQANNIVIRVEEVEVPGNT
jgi:hypothetical protein